MNWDVVVKKYLMKGLQSGHEESSSEPNNRIRKYALLAIGVLLIDKFSSYVILSSCQSRSLNMDLYLNIQSIFVSMMLPILIVIFIEERQIKSLGFTFGKLHPCIYIGLVIVFVILPLIYFGPDRSLLIQVLEQILFIAFAEEVLWRGYFQKRLSKWIGDHEGILLAAFLFGVGHIISIHAIEGYFVPIASLMTLMQTTLGGLIFGYLFYLSESVWPGAILHLFGNVFLFRIV